MSRTVADLPTGLLRVSVSAYSSRCERWSKPVAVEVQWRNPLSPPAQVRDLSVDTATSPGSAIITWKKPADIGAERDARCAYVSEGGDQASKHAAASIKYRYAVYNAQTGARLADAVEFSTADANLSRTFSNLPAGQLRVEVRAHSSHCDSWSKSVAAQFQRRNPPPTQVRDLATEVTSTQGRLLLTWKKPADVGDAPNAGCAYIAPGADRATRHAAASLKYRYVIYNAPTGANVAAAVEFSSAAANLSRTISALPIQNWHTLGVRVSAYSPQCQRWSKPVQVEFEWLGPLKCWWGQNLDLEPPPYELYCQGEPSREVLD